MHLHAGGLVQKTWTKYAPKLNKALHLIKSFFIPWHKFFQTPWYHLYGFTRKSPIEGIHLGGGDNRIQHFINIDANIFCQCDVVSGIDPLKLRSNSVKTIYCSHIFEHISHRRIEHVLSEWYRVLQPGGDLYISVPDIEILFQIYLEKLTHYKDGEKNTVDLAAGIIYGGQTTRFDFHHYGYSYTTMQALLESVGFKNIARFDREELVFAPFDDAARSARIKTIPISLNISASK
jgi:predicted SAM-dependent methyltransferase